MMKYSSTVKSVCSSLCLKQEVNLINGHFADEQEHFDLDIGSDGALKKGYQDSLYSYRLKFPPINRDALLYLILMGGKDRPALVA